MNRMNANVNRGIVTLVHHSPLKGSLKSFVDTRIAALRKTGRHDRVLKIYQRLKKTGKIRVVAIRARLMASPRFLGACVVELRRGADVTVLARKGSWVKVSYRQRVGWVHKNRIFPRVIRLSSGGTGSGTSRGEAELSGRG
jgi:hypothetical protein